MGYIYRLPYEFTLIPNREKLSLDYMPLKKNISPMIRSISIYNKNDYGEGIFGLGSILSETVYKSSDIINTKSLNFINRNYFQLNIHLDYIGRFPFVDIRYLRHFPSYNHKWFRTPYNPYVLYWAVDLNEDIRKIFSRFWYDFELNSFFRKTYWKSYIHFLRENDVKGYWNIKLPKETGKCNICGKKSDEPYFLEVHDTTDIDFDKKYVPININNFIVVCPNCHKELHLEIRKETTPPRITELY